METQFRCKPQCPFTHHHHHHHHHHHCHHHHHHHHHHCHHHHHHHHHHRQCVNCHCHVNRPHYPLQNPQFISNYNHLNSFNTKEANTSHSTEVSAANTHGGAEMQEIEGLLVAEEEEEGDPVFVLTDEWRELFAKSEARREQERQKRKKKEKR